MSIFHEGEAELRVTRINIFSGSLFYIHLQKSGQRFEMKFCTAACCKKDGRPLTSLI